MEGKLNTNLGHITKQSFFIGAFRKCLVKAGCQLLTHTIIWVVTPPPGHVHTLALVTVGAYQALAIQLTHNGDVDPKLAKRWHEIGRGSSQQAEAAKFCSLPTMQPRANCKLNSRIRQRVKAYHISIKLHFYDTIQATL